MYECMYVCMVCIYKCECVLRIGILCTYIHCVYILQHILLVCAYTLQLAVRQSGHSYDYIWIYCRTSCRNYTFLECQYQFRCLYVGFYIHNMRKIYVLLYSRVGRYCMYSIYVGTAVEHTYRYICTYVCRWVHVGRYKSRTGIYSSIVKQCGRYVRGLSSRHTIPSHIH